MKMNPEVEKKIMQLQRRLERLERTPGKKKLASSPVAPDEQTSDILIAGLANNAYSSELLSVTVDGDEETALDLDVYISGIWITAGLGVGAFQVSIWDGTIGSGTLLQVSSHQAAGLSLYSGPPNLTANVDPWAGSKTFRVALRNITGGSSDFRVHCGATYPAIMRAHWTAPAPA